MKALSITSISLGILPLLASPASGQAGSLFASNGNSGGTLPATATTVSWPSALTTSNELLAVEVGDLDGDGREDGVVLSSGELVFFPWINDYTLTNVVLGSDGNSLACTDFALMGKSGIMGEAELMFTIGPGGLLAHAWDEVLQDFVITDQLATDWNQASEVVAMDWNGDGLVDLIGLNDTRTELLVRIRKGDGTWLTNTPLNLGLPVSEIAPLQWSGNGELELALVNALGVHVLAQDGTVLFTRGTTFPYQSVARVQNAGSTDGLAWLLGPDPAGNSYILCADATGKIGFVGLPSLEPAAIAAGDIDGDGDDDFVVTARKSLDCTMVELDSFDFSMTYQGFLDASPSNGQPGIAGQQGQPYFAELNGDGMADLLLPAEVGPGVFIFESGTQLGQLALGASNGFQQSNPSFCVGSGTNASLTPIYSNPADSLATNLEVTVWHQPAPGAYVDQNALSHCVVSASGPGTSQGISVALSLAAGEVWDDTGGQTGNQTTSLFYVMVQPLDSTDEPIGRASHAVFAPSGDDLDIQEAHSSWTAIQPVDVNAPCGTQSIQNGIATGGWMGGRRVPPLPPRKKPIKGDTCNGSSGS